jgi:hypothetical protein
MLRAGTNWSDRKEIKEYVDAGETNATRIARNLGVVVAPVQGYIDFLTAPAEEACEPETTPIQEPAEEETAPRRRRKKTDES